MASPGLRHELARTYYFLSQQGPFPVGPPPGDISGAPEVSWVPFLAGPHEGPHEGSPPNDQSEAESRESGSKPRHPHEYMHAAIELLETLIDEYPNVPEFAASEADILLRLVYVLHAARQYDDAEGLLRRALELQSSLAQTYPDVMRYEMQMAAIQAALDRLRWDRDLLAAASRSAALMPGFARPLGSTAGMGSWDPYHAGIGVWPTVGMPSGGFPGGLPYGGPSMYPATGWPSSSFFAGAGGQPGGPAWPPGPPSGEYHSVPGFL